MPPAVNAGGPAPPDPARTQFRVVGAGLVPSRWDLLASSPIIKALPFLDWQYNAREKEIFASSFAQE